jgi:hypothetical protein
MRSGKIAGKVANSNGPLFYLAQDVYSFGGQGLEKGGT